MFDIKLFNYDAETHTATYDGKPIPSTTQLIGLAYPMGDIPKETLEQASIRGTKIHEMVEELNYCETYEEMSKLAYNTKNEDLISYVRLVKTFGIQAVSCEKLVFLFDNQHNIICYGHYDMVVQTSEITDFADNLIENLMCDLKTVSDFDDDKVQLQTEIYRTAYNQSTRDKISDRTCGIHLRDGKAKLHLYSDTRSDSEIIHICLKLKELWEKQNDRASE